VSESDQGAPGQPRRPVPLGSMPDIAGGSDPADRTAAAHATAAIIVQAARGTESGPEHERLLALADDIGLEELAELWRDTGPDTLPGTLWSLYLLRTWVARDGRQVSRLYSAGTEAAAFSTVLAGVEEPPGPDEVARLGDAVLTSAFSGDFGVALERAAAFCRVVATGRAHLAADQRDTRLASGNLRMAEQLEHAAGLWRNGELT